MPYGTLRETDGIVFAAGVEIYAYNPLDRKCSLLATRKHRVDCLDVGNYRNQAYQEVPFVADSWTKFFPGPVVTKAEINVLVAKGEEWTGPLQFKEDIWSLCFNPYAKGMGSQPRTPWDCLKLIIGRGDNLGWEYVGASRRRDFPKLGDHNPCMVISYGGGHGPLTSQDFWLSGSTLYSDLKKPKTEKPYHCHSAKLIPVGETKEAVHVLHYGMPSHYPDGARLSHGVDTFLRFNVQRLGIPVIGAIYHREGEYRFFFGTQGYYHDEPWFRVYDEPIGPTYIADTEPVLRLERSLSDEDFAPDWGNPCRAIELTKLEQLLG
jgi:hypothetical protein